MKKMNIVKKISTCISVLIVLGVTVYIYGLTPKPDKFILDYLNTRYTDTDYTNISEKAEQQKQYLESSLISSDFVFGKFNDEIEYFTYFKYKIEKAEFNIYDVQKQDNLHNVYVRIYFNVKSENAPDWSQLSFYDLRFTLNKYKWGYVISNVIILDNKYEIPKVLSEHVHDENCTHD